MNPLPCAGGHDREQREVVAASVEREWRVQPTLSGITVREHNELAACGQHLPLRKRIHCAVVGER